MFNTPEASVRIAALCSVPAILLFFITSAGAAQSSGSASAPPASNAINLNVVVTGHEGKPVTGLQQFDFTILDNKVPQKITSFRPFAGNSAPVAVILLIDDVNTGYFFMPDERRRIESFLQSNGGKLPYPTSMLIFTDANAPVPQDYTRDGNKLSNELLNSPISERPIKKSGGAAGEADRYTKSLRMLNQVIQSVSMSEGRTVVIWVSPGWPLLNGPGNSLSKSDQLDMFNELENFTGSLRKNQVALYMINPEGVSNVNAFRGVTNSNSFEYEQFLKPPQKPHNMQCGNLSLQGMVLHSGGTIQGWSNDIAGMLQKVFDDQAAYYQLSYNAPAGPPDRYHNIEIKLDKSKLKARTTAGYYSGY